MTDLTVYCTVSLRNLHYRAKGFGQACGARSSRAINMVVDHRAGRDG
jgi:hypothetical protein